MGTGRPSLGTVETRTLTRPDHPTGAPSTYRSDLARAKCPTQWKCAFIIVIHKEGGTKCRNYRGISLVSHAGKVLLKVVARRLSNYCVAKERLPEEQYGFRPDRLIMDIIIVLRRLQEIG